MAHVNRLANTRILVFGGTSGIGYAVANMALSYGARVTISGSAQLKVDKKTDELRSNYPNISSSYVAGLAVDLLDLDNLEDNLRYMLEKATEGSMKKFDHIVFTAGDVSDMPKIASVTVESAMHGFKVRFLGPSIIAKLLCTGRYIYQSSSSSMTLTGGTNTHRPMPNWTFGAAWGAASEGLTRGLAVDLAPIRVNIVIPGAIQTELLSRFLSQVSEKEMEVFVKSYSLTNTLGQPEDIAEAYGWIMKDRFANGGQVTSDGGRLLVSDYS